MKSLFLTLIIALICSSHLQAQQQPVFNPAAIREYYLLLLKPGAERGQDSATVATIQAGHLNHLKSLYESGKICLVGPVDGSEELRGICVFLTETREEAMDLASKDPAVIAGRLKPEILSWYTMPGGFLPAK